jgi:hypothetical protein
MIAAKGIHRTDTSCDIRIHTSRCIIGDAAQTVAHATIIRTGRAVFFFVTDIVPATNRTFSTVFRTTFAGLSAIALQVTADRFSLTITTLFGIDFLDAKVVPLAIAAECIYCADTFFNVLVVTARRSVGLTAISIARAAIVSFPRTDAVPLDIAAIGIQGADTGLDIRVATTRRIIGDAARTFASATVQLATRAVFIWPTNFIATSRRTLAAVFRT